MVFDYMDHDLTGLMEREGSRFTVPQVSQSCHAEYRLCQFMAHAISLAEACGVHSLFSVISLDIANAQQQCQINTCNTCRLLLILLSTACWVAACIMAQSRVIPSCLFRQRLPL